MMGEYWEPASKAEPEGPGDGGRGKASKNQHHSLRLVRGFFAFFHHPGSDLHANFSVSKSIPWRLRECAE